MTKSISQLSAVGTARRARDDKKARLKIEADAWIVSQLIREEAAVDEAVMDALDNGHSITSVAGAYTVSGRTPDRNAIYEIKSRHTGTQDLWVDEYPFEWVPREVQTVSGFTTVYDVRAVLEEFGPSSISGEFTWRYDRITDELEPVITESDPYPQGEKYYASVLKRWLIGHEYPKEKR